MDVELLKRIIADQNESLFVAQKEIVERNLSLTTHITIPEVTVITGVRRCGKSMLLKQLVSGYQSTHAIHYLNFEDSRTQHFTVKDFEIALQLALEREQDLQKPRLVIYDEVQLIDGWERWVASLQRDARTKIIITGSNSRLLSSELSTLLTGRHLDAHLTPLSFKEVYKNYINNPRFDSHSEEQLSTTSSIQRQACFATYLRYGGFPRVFLGQLLELCTQYYEDVIIKDIAARKSVRNISGLRALGSLMASQNTRLFNRSKAAIAIGIKDQVTVTKFCRYFVESYLFSELKNYSASRAKQIRSLSKFYCIDHALARENGFFQSKGDSWALENIVANELLRRGETLFYYVTKDRKEIDFLVQHRDGTFMALQVATDISDPITRQREISALESAKKELPISRCFILTERTRAQIDSPQISVRPIPDWALEID